MGRRAALFASLLTAGALSLAAAPGAGAAITTQDVAHGVTPVQMANALAGADIAVSNVSYTGAPGAAGTFGGGSGIIGFGNGIVLSTGSIANVVGPNTSTAATTENGRPGDADLSALAGAATYDAASLQFDFTPPANATSVTFSYVFGSEEYDEWVGKGFNDVFAFYVNGHNCALVPSTTDPVSVDSINANKNSAYFVDNTDAHLNTQLDGLTTVLSCSSPVNGGQLNHMKLAIADSGDQDLDSDVLLQAGSLTVNRPPVARLTASPINGEWPLPVTFDGSGSSDPDGPLASWSLDFGDGTPAATGTGSPPSSIPHTYADPGSYTAALTVRDAQGATDTASVPITVSKAATALAASPALLQLQGLRLYLGNLNAKLTRSSTSAPIAGEVVRFFAGSTQVCQATTNSSGVASCGGLLPTGVQVTLSLGYKAVFAGDSRYLGSSATGSLLG